MLQIVRDAGAVVLAGVLGAMPVAGIHIVLRTEVSAQIGAQDTLLTQFGTQRCLAAPPVEVASGLDAIHISLVEVLAELLSAHELEIVIGAVPIYLRGEVELALGLSLHRDEVALVALILVGIGCAVEGVGSVGLLREAELPVEGHVPVAEVALIIELALAPVAVERTAVAASATTADSVSGAPKYQSHTGIGIEGAKAAALGSCLEGGLLLMTGDDIDGPTETLSAIHTAGGTLEHLNALDVADADGEVSGQMSCVWIADVDTVEQDGNLVKDAAIDGDVRLDTKATALPDIHARG